MQLRTPPGQGEPEAPIRPDPRLVDTGSTSPTTRFPTGDGSPPFSRGRGAPVVLGQRELAEELDGMAASLNEVDPRSAERLADLARSIGTEEGRTRWADVDLRRAFNTERLAQAYAIRREGGFASPVIDIADRARQVLILLPILLTWYALSEASKAYDSYIANNPTEVRLPLLLLWQRGFGGEASPFAPSFATVALTDALIIALIIVLTFFAHGRREKREDQIAATAGHFQTDLDNALGAATVALAANRGTQPALLVRSVERLAERFDRSTQELLNRLRVEHERLEAVANRREREFADFGVFASGMRAGAEETHRLLIDLRQVSGALQTVLEDLTGEVGMAGDHQRSLLQTMGNLERLIASGIQSDQIVTRQLTDATASLADAADKATTGAEAASQAGRIATEAVRGIAELATTLATSQARLEAATAAEAESNSRLADALRGSAGGISSSTRQLNEIGAGLAQLREEFGRLVDLSADQANSLGALLSEQSTIASGLSQVARDLSAVGIATAQRQREVNEDLAVLLNRLDGLTTLLARATASTPNADALQQAVSGTLRSELRAQTEAILDTIGSRASSRPKVPMPSGSGEDPRSPGEGPRSGVTGWPRSQRRPGS
ncbi:MAG: hypothetical protein M3Q71_02890 [Chloroflexota bacterium]|nr:hypothetical protein [Chloroflexota bacterium]